MLEEVHAVAPNASLYFCSPGTTTLYISCVQQFAAAGVQIAVDDIGYPLLSDTDLLSSNTIYSQSVQGILSQNPSLNLVTVTANSAQNYWEGSYAPTLPSQPRYCAANGHTDSYVQPFNGSALNRIDVLSGNGQFFFQWSDSFGSNQSNFDLYIYDSSFNLITCVPTGSSSSTNWLSGAVPTGTYYISIGTPDTSLAGKFLKLSAGYNNNVTMTATASGGIRSLQALAQGVVTVGAVNGSDGLGNSIETFSNTGPITFKFPSPSTVQAPYFTAPDGVNVDNVGTQFSASTFYGTSAAAPNAAAVLGLLRSAFPSLTAVQLASYAENGATVLGGSSPNGTYGYGRIDALGMLNAIPAPSVSSIAGVSAATGTTSSPVSFTLGGTGKQTLTVSSSNTALVPSSIVASGNPGITISPSNCGDGVTSCSLTVQSVAGQTGTANITISARDGANRLASSAFSATITLVPQTITWTQTLSGAVGGTVSLNATASSNLPVSYSSSTTSVCTVSSSTLSLIAAGSCTVTASQAGNAYYAAASPVGKTFAVTGPVVSVTPSSFAFGNQAVNTTSASTTLTVKNNGASSVVVSGVTVTGTDSSSFLPTTGCSSLSANATCTVALTFKPTTTGAKSANLNVASNAPGSPTVVTLTGTGVVASPAISLSSNGFAFGNQIVGTTSATQNLTVTNTGSATLTISSIALGGSAPTSFTKAGSCASLAVNASCSLSLAFAPVSAGSLTATLTVSSNATGNATSVVNLSGTGVVTTIAQFAGTSDGPGFLNGTGTAARFNGPSGIAIDSSGNLFVADSNNTLVRQITSAGVVTTVAGQTLVGGSVNGTGTAARFYLPFGITISGTTLYLADFGNSFIRKLTTAGVVTTLAGTAGVAGSTDGTGTAAKFYAPLGVVSDSAGNVFVADTYNGAIRKVTSAGVTTTFAGTAGSFAGTDGTGTAARFASPVGMGRDASNSLFVTDVGGSTIRKVTSSAVVSTLAGSYGQAGSANGTGSSARFSRPYGAVVDGSGNVFVADYANGTIRQVTSAGVVTTLAGSAGSFGSTDGTGSAARFNGPVGIARDSSGNLYVADFNANTIRKIAAGGVVTTFAGTSSVYGANDNTGSLARFLNPSGVVADNNGNLFISDTGNHTIRKVTPAGVVTTFAGSAGVSGSADGAGTLARFNGPTGLAIDASGNIYVADTGNHTIRKVDTTGAVTTVAGLAGTAGSTNATGSAARFKSPAALAVTSGGILYVADTGNYTIRKIVLSSGAVTTLAGAAGSYGTTDSATGTSARFGGIYGLGVDGSGNIYAADFNGSTIRKIVPTGTVAVSTFAGTANNRGTTNGTGTAARFSSPYGLTVDASNNIYVSDYANCLLRKITSTAVVTTPVGTAGNCKFVAANAPSTINVPLGLAKFGTSLFFVAGNGVAQVTNVP